MGTPTYHNNQWGHTEHAGRFCGSLITEKLEDRHNGKEILEILTKNPAYGTEKFDGTNVGKCSETGQLFGRRILIENGTDKYVGTSLEKVKEADVEGFRIQLLKTAQVRDLSKAGKLIMYGELMCNDKYGYGEKGLVGNWLIFGAILEDKSNGDGGLLQKLLEAGYAVRGTFSKECIQIFLNEKFVKIADQLGILCAPRLGCGETIADIVKENKDFMKTGDCEGVVISFGSKELGFRLVKWKGAHEEQPASNEEVKMAIKKLNSAEVIEYVEQLDFIKDVFKHFNEVIEETSKNKKCVRKKGKKENKQDKESQKHKNMKDNVINFAIKSAMTKFDIPEAYAAKGEEGKDHYVGMVTGEVIEDINSNQKLSQEDTDVEDIRKRVSSIYVRRTSNKNTSENQIDI